MLLTTPVSGVIPVTATRCVIYRTDMNLEVRRCNNVLITSVLHAILLKNAQTVVVVDVVNVFYFIYRELLVPVLPPCPRGNTKQVDVTYPALVFYASSAFSSQ